MKKTILGLFLAMLMFSTYSCRETTEMNTDGDMEKNETRAGELEEETDN